MRLLKSSSTLAIVLLAASLGCEDSGLSRLSPQIEITPTPIVLPATAVGLSSQAPFTIKNRGGASLTVSRLVLEGSSQLSVVGSTVALALAPGEERPLAIAFRPAATGPTSGVLRVSSDDPDQPTLEVPVLAERRGGPVLLACVSSPDLGLAKKCTDDSLAVDLGIVGLGETLTATVTLESVGNAPVDLSAFGLSTDSTPSFSITGAAAPLTLPPGARATATVRFAPTVAGPAKANVDATSNDLVRAGKRLQLSALGTAKALCVSPATLDFGGVPLASTSTLTTIASACGGRTVVINAINVIEGADSFTLVNPLSGPVPLASAAGLGFGINVRFKPTTAGTAQGRLRISSDVGEVFVSLRGSSGVCDLQVTPASLTLQPTNLPETFVIQNSGSAPCSLESVALAAGAPREYAIDPPPGLPATLLPGELRTATVRLSERGESAPPTTALVTFSSAGGTGSRSVALSAAGTPEPGSCALVATPAAITFGLVGLGESAARTVVFTNDGSGVCTLSSVDLAQTGSAFSLELIRSGGNNAGPIDVSPGTLIAGVVRFTSASAVNATAKIVARFVAAGTPDLEVPVSATTNGPRLCLSTTRVDLGPAASTSTTVTLTSCGTADLVVSGLAFDPLDPEFSLNPAPSTPLTLSPGASATLTVAYASVDAIGDFTQLVVSSNDGAEPQQKVVLTAGANVPEVCGNGIDEDGDRFIDEDCVPELAIGRAVVVGQGRLFVWGDEHAKLEQYGAAPAPFWRGVFRWLSCEGCPGPRRTRIGDVNANLNPLMRAEARALGLSVVDVRGPGPDVDALLVVANFVSPDPAYRSWVEAGGALMIMSIGLGPGECDGLDPFTAGFPLRFDCRDPNPFGPVGRFLPHPISFGLQSTDSPFVNGRFVVEDPNTRSTVIALP